MISVNSNSVMQNCNISAIAGKNSIAKTSNETTQTRPSNLNFGATSKNTNIRTSLITKEDKEKYNTLTKMLAKEDKEKLNFTLKTGLLLNNESNDKSSVLDNLYNIATKERATGLDNKKILTDTLTAIANPHTITQKFGDIPDEYKSRILDPLTKDTKNLIEKKMIETQTQMLFSACCVAASEQFNLCERKPAEYARFAEGLSSPKKSVDKEIKLENLSENTLDAIYLLNTFEIPYKPKDYATATITLAPDEGAYTRAEMQQDFRDNMERSPVDVLMQSTFMNVASQQTYNSLNDKRAGKFSNEDSGLIDYEKTFLESIVEDKNIISVTYQDVDENQKVVGYSADYETVKSQLTQTLDRGQNIIIGYTMTDANSQIYAAHEIAIIDYKTDKNGEVTFICNDTDDDDTKPVEYAATYIVPKIHHAGIPEDIASKDMEQTDSWRCMLKELDSQKNSSTKNSSKSLLDNYTI